MKIRSLGLIPFVAVGLVACNSGSEASTSSTLGASSVTNVAQTASTIDISKISGFSENWSSASFLNTSPYQKLSNNITIGFLTNKSDSSDLYWGDAATIGTPLIDPRNPVDIINYVNASGHPASQFMLSFGGATNDEGWKLLQQSGSSNAIELADKLANIVNSAGLAGVDVDIDVPYLDTVFKQNFKTFFAELRQKLGNKKISVDLPNLGACTRSSSLPVCTWAYGWGATNINNAAWFFQADSQGNNAIDSYVDYYNVMNYSWGGGLDASTSLQYSENALQTYLNLGVSPTRLNYGLDVGEDTDRNNITSDNLSKIITYVNTEQLKGIFIWDYNYDQLHASLNNYGNMSLVNALSGGSPEPGPSSNYILEVSNLGPNTGVQVTKISNQSVSLSGGLDWMGPGTDKVYNNTTPTSVAVLQGATNLVVHWETYPGGPSGDCSEKLNFTANMHIMINPDTPACSITQL